MEESKKPCTKCLPIFKRWEKCETINNNIANNSPFDDKPYWLARARMYGIKKARVMQDCVIDHKKEHDNAA